MLGPLEVRRDGQSVELRGAKRRALLALLILHANEVVRTDRLVDELWGEHPPANAPAALQNHVSRLRKALGVDVLVTKPWGYVLRAEPDTIDLQRFETLVAEARALAARPARAAAGGARSVARVRARRRGIEPALVTEVARLEELRLSALEQRIDTDLELGGTRSWWRSSKRSSRSIRSASGCAGNSILTLYRAGRQAEALEAYRETRRVLVEELGIEPSPELRELEQAILRQEPALVVALPRPGPASETGRGGAGLDRRSRSPRRCCCSAAAGWPQRCSSARAARRTAPLRLRCPRRAARPAPQSRRRRRPSRSPQRRRASRRRSGPEARTTPPRRRRPRPSSARASGGGSSNSVRLRPRDGSQPPARSRSSLRPRPRDRSQPLARSPPLRRANPLSAAGSTGSRTTSRIPCSTRSRGAPRCTATVSPWLSVAVGSRSHSTPEPCRRAVAWAPPTRRSAPSGAISTRKSISSSSRGRRETVSSCSCRRPSSDLALDEREPERLAAQRQ